MKRLNFLALALTASLAAACTPPAANTNTNTNANTNTNTAKPVAAAPTVDTFLDMEKKANEAYARGDSAYFDAMLSDKTVMSMGKDRMGKAAIVEMMKTTKCDITDGVKLSEPQMTKINDDTYAFTYKNETKGSCMENGKSMDMKTMRASTLWTRNGDKWQAVWHSENEIMGAAPAAGEKKDANSADAKKEAPKAPEAKKDASNSAANTGSSNTNANSAPAPAKLTPSANTDALTKAHAAGWEAFRNKDAKHFEDHLTSGFTFIDPMGSVMNKADSIKEWTGAGKMKCEGITKTTFTDSFAQALSPTVEMLFGKGNADGTCNGEKNGDLWTTAVYVKEGEAWKLAYMFESMPHPGM